MSRRGGVLLLTAGDLVLSGETVLIFANAMKQRRDALRNGGKNDPDVERWTDAATEGAGLILGARRSEIGTSDVPIVTGSAPVPMLDPVDTQQAAKILTRSTREVVRLIRRKDDQRPFPSARIVSGRYLIERSEVLARAERTA